MKSGKSAGYDEINPDIIKKCNALIAEPLTYVINLSLLQGKFPEKLKYAVITPVFKSGDKTKVKNYRPISILPCFSKIYEKIVYKQLYEHLTLHNLLFEKQFGFQENHSTDHAALLLTEKILDSFDKNEFTASIFIDLSKAFDTVDHDILIKKLNYYGVSGVALQWFISYLQKRKQLVINGENYLDITRMKETSFLNRKLISI